MAITRIDYSMDRKNTIGTWSLPLSGTASGDLVIVFTTLGSTGATLDYAGPSGYTTLVSNYYTVSNNGLIASNSKIFFKFLASAETSVALPSTGGAGPATGIAIVMRGVNATTPFDVAETKAFGALTTIGVSPNPPAITPVNASTYILSFVSTAVSASNTVGTLTWQSPFGGSFDISATDTVYIKNGFSSYAGWTSGAVDPSLSTIVSVGGAWSAINLALRDAAISSGGKIKAWNGGAWVAKPVKVWNGSSWVEKPVKRWNGSAWVPTNY